MTRFSKLLDQISDYLARRKGLLPIVGILFVLSNAIIQFVPGNGWMVESNLLLHIGVVLAILGILLAWAL
jgi:hypothetical protein